MMGTCLLVHPAGVREGGDVRAPDPMRKPPNWTLALTTTDAPRYQPATHPAGGREGGRDGGPGGDAVAAADPAERRSSRVLRPQPRPRPPPAPLPPAATHTLPPTHLGAVGALREGCAVGAQLPDGVLRLLGGWQPAGVRRSSSRRRDAGACVCGGRGRVRAAGGQQQAESGGRSRMHACMHARAVRPITRTALANDVLHTGGWGGGGGMQPASRPTAYSLPASKAIYGR